MGALTPETQQAACKILTGSDIQHEIEAMTTHVSEVTGMSKNASRALLRQFKWDKQQLFEKYYDQSSADAKIFDAAQTMDGECAAQDSEEACDICGESGRLVGLQCKHLYCSDCWQRYIKSKVDAGVCLILCPTSECPISVDNGSLKRLADSAPQLLEAFTRAEVFDYVKSNRRTKWCPGVGCERAVAVRETGSQQVDCECGESFCFDCAREWHGPLDCDFFQKWLKQFNDDSGTLKWLNENTKDCPRCKASIQKSGGCNYMVCGKCRHTFCWLCLWSWSEHTQDHFGCNRLNTDTAKTNKQGREKAMADKDRYLHYANRFMAQQQSHKLEKKLHKAVAGKITQFQKEGFSFVEAQFLDQAVRVLSTCRLSLMYTYAFAYYLDTDDNTRLLFEDLQMDLALATEALSGFLERDLGRVENLTKLKQTVQDKCRYVQLRRDALIKWSSEGGWKLVHRSPADDKKEEGGK